MLRHKKKGNRIIKVMNKNRKNNKNKYRIKIKHKGLGYSS